MRRRWVVKPADEQAVERLKETFQISDLVARLLVQRGVTSEAQVRDFLYADLSSLASPHLMADLTRAVEIIHSAIGRNEKILIVGDYDADGVTSTAVLMRSLKRLGADVGWYIPHRMTDGYGLKSKVVEEAHAAGVRLMITVDCGTTSFQEIELARSLGMHVIVVDHHDLDPKGPPPASAFLNPLRSDCPYPNKDLASVGVAFTLVRGLLEHEEDAWALLDLVAIGTVADMSALTGENRVIVKVGLGILTKTQNPGIQALKKLKKLEGKEITSEDISFSLAPPLNAMGRMGSAELSLRLLVTEDPDEAKTMTKEMAKQNKLRGKLEREAVDQALQRVTREINFSQDKVIVLADEGWHPGIVGIVATRLAKRFYRPTVIIALDDEISRGSARSVEGFHLVEALDALQEYLIDFGGHPGAAGLSMDRTQVDAFREALNRYAQSHLDAATLVPQVDVDGELPLAKLTTDVMDDLEQLAPFGVGNPRPVFTTEDAQFPKEKKKASFSPFGTKVVVESQEGQAFELFQSKESLQSWNIRRVQGSAKLAYTPVPAKVQTESGIELRLHDLKVQE